jgi:DNA-binding CsgD family transcriptional regulator
MKKEPNVQSVPGPPKAQHVKLLLVGRNEEFKGNRARRILNGNRTSIAGRSASLLGALKRLRSEAIDIVLLGDKFRDEELALFVSSAGRDGFAGLILCLSPTQPFGPDSLVASTPAAFFTKVTLRDPLHPVRNTLTVRGQNEGWSAAMSFTARQKTVLARVSEGWTNQQIARHLGCGEGTVKATLQQLFRKIGVRKRTQIVRLREPLRRRLI